MGRFDYSKIQDLFQDLSVDTATHSITYSMYPINAKSVYEERGSKLVMVKANLKVLIKENDSGEAITVPIDLLKLPHYGETGFVINGKNRQVIDLYTKSFGWYVMRRASGIKVPHLSLTSELGKNLLIYERDYELFVTTGKKPNDAEVPLSVFLKAFTGMSFSDIGMKIGMDNVYSAHSFSKNKEPLKSECVDMVITQMFDEFRGGRKAEELASMGIDEKYSMAFSRLFSPRYMILGETTGVRMKRAISFKQRCKNLSLAEDLYVGGRTIYKDTILTPKMLDEIDYSPIDELKVYDSRKKTFVVRKNSVFNFRALGCTLEEPVRAGKFLFEKGTLLTIDVLQLLDKSTQEVIKISRDGKEYTCARKIYKGSLTVDDIISMLQVYIDTLSGLDLYDDIYDLTNQNLVTVEIKALSLLKSYCKAINHYIELYLSQRSEDTDLLRRIVELSGFDTGALLDEISDVENTESQQAELNNVIQKVSKEHRVSKNVSRSSADMVSIQESQFGRLDPIESPESEKIGIVHTKTFLSREDEAGFLCAPYIRVKNGEVVSDEPVYLTAAEQQDLYIAEWNETFFEVSEDGTRKLKDKVLVLYNDTMLPVPTTEVMYMEYSPYQTMSPARMQIPFQEHSNPKRILMASNHQKQTIVPIMPERPIVSSGGDSLMTEGFITAKQVLEEYYEANLAILMGVNKEEFVSKRITLINIDSKNGSKDLFYSIEGMNGHTAVINIPFIQKASSGAMFSYKVNSTNGMTYKGEDIVAHSAEWDTKKYDVFMHTDFGNMKVDESVFANRAIGLAKNIVIGYKTYEGSTIDDSITISSELFSENTYTTMELARITYKLSDPVIEEDKGTKEHEEFGFLGRSIHVHMTDEGLPKMGSILKPGDVVIGVRRIKSGFVKGTGYQTLGTFDKSRRLEGTVEGQVVSSYIEGDEAIVMLASLSPVEVGDKFAGRYGNKSVVAKIVPPEHMPFCPKTGLRIQIILNPLGVPSRSNISQILEVVLGMGMKKLGKIAIVSPYKGKTLDFVREMADKTDTKPMMLRDGRTGQWIKRPINVGIMYIQKLEHMVNHKIRGIGLSNKTDPVFNQPTKGSGHAGGQAFGEYETWCLMAVNARKVLQDLQTVQSDDLPSIEVLKDAIKEDPNEIEIEGTNHNDHLFQVLMRSVCVEPSYDEDGGFSFKPLTDNMIRSMNPNPVDVNDKDSLRATSIFGATSNDLTKFYNRTNWSWMPLHCEMVHPFWIIKGKINRYLVGAVAREGEEGDRITPDIVKFAMLKELIAGKYYIEEEVVRGENIFVFRRGSTEGRLTGMPAMVHMLKNADLGVAKRFYEGAASRARTNENILKFKTRLRGITSFEEEGLSLKDFVITALPVMPLSFRPASIFKGSVQDFDYYYKRVMDEVAKYKAFNKSDHLGIYNIYLRIVELCGLTYTGEVKRSKKQPTPILKYFTGKEKSKVKGRIRENLLKKRVLFSGRTVIIPSSNTKRLPTQIGIPFLLCLEIWKPQLVSLLHRDLEHYRLDEEQWERVVETIGNNMVAFGKIMEVVRYNSDVDLTDVELYDQIRGVISTYVEGRRNPDTGKWEVHPRVVLAGRQPSLHKFNIRAYHPIITDKKCIEIHPLVCKGYNADFDGDQMWIIGLINDSACKEAMEKLSPKYGVINPKDNSVVLEHSQDMRLGVYFATMLHNNVASIEDDERYKQVRFYNDIKHIETDVDLEYLTVHDLVVFNNKGKKYFSTAGRILFNSMFPDGTGFTDEPFSNPLKIEGIKEDQYYDLKFDGLVSGNGGTRKEPHYVNLNKVTSWSYETFSADHNMEVFQAISEFGFKYSDISGISFYLEDLRDDPDPKGLLDKASKYEDTVNKWYYQGAISNETRKKMLIDLYNGAISMIGDEFIESFDRNNNIFIMYDSGARGTRGQIMQACGVIGILQKSKNEVLEVPVLSNYSKGNTSFETLRSSFSTRTGVASTQNETATSGELTRTAVYMASGFSVVEEDCGVDFEDMKVKYTEHLDTATLSPEGKRINTSSLIGKRLSKDDAFCNRLLVNFLGINSEITEQCVNIIIKNKVKRVICEDGEYKLFYKMDTLYRSLLRRRISKDLPYLIKGQFISDKTIDYIEMHNLETVPIRTILGCKSVGGVCAKCYGMLYDFYRMPEVGSFIGIESAQSIGEPAAQLVLSLFHKGGAAGESIDKGVDMINSLLDSGAPGRLVGAVLPPFSGYVTYNNADSNIRITSLSGEEVFMQVDNEVIVESGEYVEYDTPLTTGFIIPKELSMSPTLEQLRFKQLALLELYYRTFELSNVKINARHFEVFVRLQTSLITVISSENHKFKEGAVYEINEVLQENAMDDISYMFDIQGSPKVITHFSGMETEMARERLADTLGLCVTEQRRSPGKSLIGSLFYGQDVTGNTTKLLSFPKRLKEVVEEDNRDRGNFKKLEEFLASEIVQVTEVEEETVDIDLDSLMGLTSEEPTINATEDYIKLDESEQEEDKEKRKQEVDKMSLF